MFYLCGGKNSTLLVGFGCLEGAALLVLAYSVSASLTFVVISIGTDISRVFIIVVDLAVLSLLTIVIVIRSLRIKF